MTNSADPDQLATLLAKMGISWISRTRVNISISMKTEMILGYGQLKCLDNQAILSLPNIRGVLFFFFRENKA